MTSITLFTLETAQELYTTAEAFPIDFDTAWQWLGYSRKADAKKLLVKNFIENEDFTIEYGDRRIFSTTDFTSISDKAHLMRTEIINVTPNCLKEMGMLAGTEKGREIRKYFLQCERLVKESHQKLLEQSEHYQKLLKRVALDEEKLEFLKISERMAIKMKDRTGMAITRWQIKDHLEATRPEMRLKASIPYKPVKPFFLVTDAVRTKIFQDLLKACKGQPKKVSDFRTHSLGRRLDVLSLYGEKKKASYLRKIGIIALFTDASKHGYGSFDPIKNIFKPSETLQSVS